MSFFDSFLSFAGDVAGPALSLGSTIVSSNAANQGAQAVQNAADNNSQAMLEIDRRTRQDTAPYRDVGSSALYNLASLSGVEYEGAPGTMEERRGEALSRFVGDPSYAFRLNEGEKAINRLASAGGKRFSGETLKAANTYAQDLASTEFGNYTNRLASLAGVGQTANQQSAVTGSNTAANIGQGNLAAAGARASAYGQQADAINQGFNNAAYWMESF